MLVMIAPITISANPAQAMRGVAMRELSKVAEAKYSTAISKKMIQNSSTLAPCPVRMR